MSDLRRQESEGLVEDILTDRRGLGEDDTVDFISSLLNFGGIEELDLGTPEEDGINVSAGVVIVGVGIGINQLGVDSSFKRLGTGNGLTTTFSGVLRALTVGGEVAPLSTVDKDLRGICLPEIFSISKVDSAIRLLQEESTSSGGVNTDLAAIVVQESGTDGIEGSVGGLGDVQLKTVDLDVHGLLSLGIDVPNTLSDTGQVPCFKRYMYVINPMF